MKETEKKLAFITARAEGKSYRAISEELGISKSTCSSWEHSLADQIETLKREKLEELYTSYGMTREARIKSLGDIITRIDEARDNIADKPLETLPEDRLIELRLKVMRELQTLYKEPVRSSDDTLDGILEEYNKLYEDSKSEKLTASEIRARVDVLDAKRDLLYRIASEKTQEEEEGGFNIQLGYTSKLIRHEDGEEAL